MPLSAFCAPPNLPVEHHSALCSSPEDDGILPSAHLYNDHFFNDFVPGLNTISLDYWNASNFTGFIGFNAEPITAPATPKIDALNVPGPVPERLLQPSIAKKPRGKRTNHPSERPTRKSTKRKSSQDEETNMQMDGNKEPTNSHGNDGNSNDCGGDNPTKPSKRQGNGDMERIRISNRVSAHKSRAKKSQASQRLETDEKNKKRANSGLTNCVADLTLKVFDLKMQLLQHTDCNCFLIQRYIAHEAEQYIQGFERSHDGGELYIDRP